jgi:zinc protease
MRRIGLCLALVLLPAARLLAFASLPILDPAKVTEKNLPNGLHLVIKEDRQWPVVALGMYVKAGSVNESASERGVAHLVEHLLFETTDERSEKLAPAIEDLGGRVSATTMRDFAHLNVVVASRSIETVLPLVVRSVFTSSFLEADFKREQAVVKREIADRDDRAEQFLDNMIWRLAFPTHPYGRPIGGTPEDLDKLTYAMARAFHKRFYVPNNAALVVAGDVDPDWVTSRVGQLTAQLPSQPTQWQVPAAEPVPATPRVKTDHLARNISLLAMAWQAPGIAHKEDCCAMDLIYTLLSQGAYGRLNRALVEQKKVALSADADFLTQRYPGLLVIQALVPTGKEEAAQAAVLEEVARMSAEPVTVEELDRAKRLLYTEYAFTNETYDDQVSSMGFYEAIDSYKFALDYIRQVLKVTPEQLQAVAKQYLTPGSYSLALLRGEKTDEGGK